MMILSSDTILIAHIIPPKLLFDHIRSRFGGRQHCKQSIYHRLVVLTVGPENCGLSLLSFQPREFETFLTISSCFKPVLM
jgi:hypothetical protein